MAFLVASLSFQRISRVTRLFSVAISIFHLSITHAFSPIKGTRDSIILFSSGSSSLSESAKYELSTQLSCIRSIDLEVVLILAFGDDRQEERNGSDQVLLANQRANAVRSFFVDAGISNSRIYTEAKASADRAIRSLVKDPKIDGMAVVESTGNCKPTEPGKDCAALCILIP